MFAIEETNGNNSAALPLTNTSLLTTLVEHLQELLGYQHEARRTFALTTTPMRTVEAQPLDPNFAKNVVGGCGGVGEGFNPFFFFLISNASEK